MDDLRTPRAGRSRLRTFLDENRLLLAFTAIVVGAKLSTIVLPPIADEFCSAPLAAKAIPDLAYGCAEFWFNRYQQMAGALVALGAALIAVRPVYRQLRFMERQVAADRYDILAARFADADKKAHAVKIFGIDAGKHAPKYYTPEWLDLNAGTPYPKAAEDTRERYRKFIKALDELGEHSVGQQSRTEILEALRDLLDAGANYAQLLSGVVAMVRRLDELEETAERTEQIEEIAAFQEQLQSQYLRMNQLRKFAGGMIRAETKALGVKLDAIVKELA